MNCVGISLWQNSFNINIKTSQVQLSNDIDTDHDETVDDDQTVIYGFYDLVLRDPSKEVLVQTNAWTEISKQAKAQVTASDV